MENVLDAIEDRLTEAGQAYAGGISGCEEVPWRHPHRGLHRAGCDDAVGEVDGGFTNPHRAAARAVTELLRIDDAAAVIARNSRCAVLIAVADKTMVLVDSRMTVWRLYSLSGTRTPLSMTIECPGPSPNARVFPLRSQLAEVSEVEARLSLDLPSLVAEMGSLIACM